MAISLAFRTTILISLIALTCSNRCTSHPQVASRLLHSTSNKTKESPKKNTGYLHSKPPPASKWTTDSVSIISHVTSIARPAAFLANISIGDPPVPQLLLLDTGSDLTWIQCLPCKCYLPPSIPFYRPSRSSTYRDASCESAPHAMPRISHDERTKTCQYYLRYRDNSSTRGVLAEENLTFQTSDNGLVSKQNIVIGCGKDKSGFTQYSGVLGLGPGQKLLDIKPYVFKRYGSQGGTVIDTGCSPTILAREAYDTLFEEIDFLLGDVLTRVKDWDQYTKACYEGNMKLNLLGFPVVTFHFAGGAELTLDYESLFVESENGDSFCLAMSMNTFDDMSVIGAMAQQHYNVGYDLLTMNVYFQRTDCVILDS
ncbi:Aspartyl protease family protein [Hirschfeldia incana]|nr:Aspartyl protease family protein [Hirschfeldia incana]